MMPINYHGNLRPWGFGQFGFFGILFWGLIIFLAVTLLVKLFSLSRNQIEDNKEISGKALDILKERYAKGEIDSKEFEKMKKDIA